MKIIAILFLFFSNVLAAEEYILKPDIAKPDLPIWKLTDKSTNEEILKAYKESLSLMVIYSNKLEGELKLDSVGDEKRRAKNKEKDGKESNINNQKVLRK